MNKYSEDELKLMDQVASMIFVERLHRLPTETAAKVAYGEAEILIEERRKFLNEEE